MVNEKMLLWSPALLGVLSILAEVCESFLEIKRWSLTDLTSCVDMGCSRGYLLAGFLY